MPLAPFGPVMVISEVMPKALGPAVPSPEVERLMVAGALAVRPAAKTMVSAPAAALASIIACRSEPAPESPVIETVKVAGTILCSRLRSSSLGEPEALRAFLFGELLKSLRKAFKSMDGEFLY